MRTGHSSAIVTKLLQATAFHCRAALIPLHPESAFRTLLESGPFSEVNKRSVFRIHSCVITILFAAHSVMELASALQTIPLSTIFAVVLSDARISFEESLAARSRTPGSIRTVSLYVLIHHIILILPMQIAFHENLHLVVAHLYPAVLRRTLDRQYPTFDAILDMRVKTLVVVDMRAVQDHNRFRGHVHRADGAFILCEAEAHHDRVFRVVFGIPLIEEALILKHLLDVCFEMLAKDLLGVIVFLTAGASVADLLNFEG